VTCAFRQRAVTIAPRPTMPSGCDVSRASVIVGMVIQQSSLSDSCKTRCSRLNVAFMRWASDPPWSGDARLASLVRRFPRWEMRFPCRQFDLAWRPIDAARKGEECMTRHEPGIRFDKQGDTTAGVGMRMARRASARPGRRFRCRTRPNDAGDVAPASSESARNGRHASSRAGRASRRQCEAQRLIRRRA
jgi:hypothetical protein